MANPTHIRRLQGGVKEWNAWKARLKKIQPDLSGIDLTGWPLCDNIDEDGEENPKKPVGIDLSRTNLAGVKLDNAILSYSNLTGANLTGASLRRTYLDRCSLIRSTLRGIDLTRSIMGGTLLITVDLSTAKGLSTIHHAGPSAISIDTLYRSKGQIPEIFLRGCGIPDPMIEYARSLVLAERPIDYYSVFISYSSADEALAERLYADLQAKGVRCWLAPHDLKPGEVIVRGIDEAIRLHDKVVLLLSEAAVASSWVEYEVNLATTREAREGRTVLYPLRLDDAVLTAAEGWAQALRDGRHIGDFRQWTEYTAYQAVFGRLLRDLKAEQR